MRTVLLLVLLAVFAGCGCAADSGSSVAELAEKVKPAIVTIITYDAAGEESGQGTGFLIDSSKVLTCYHVIGDASKISIKTAKGKTISVREVDGYDEAADLARLTLASPVEGAKPLTLSRSLPRQGERIVVIGAPLGLESTVSDGIVSAVRESPGLPTVIQLTAPISPGSSGSPVLNLEGSVVGIVRATVVEGQNINFAVASQTALSLKSSPSALPISRQIDGLKAELLAGYLYFMAGDYARALPHLEAAIRIDRENVLAWGLKGYCCLELGRNTDAVGAYKQAIRIDPELAQAHYNLGVAYADLGRYTDAIDAYKQAIRIDPEYAMAQYNLGVAYVNLGRYTDAIDAFKQAIRIDPEYADAHCGLGAAYVQLGRYTDAIGAYKQAIRIDPEYAAAHCNLGVAYVKLGRYTDAIDAYKQAIRINPELAQAHLNLGLAYLLVNDRNSALEQYKVLKGLDAEMAKILFSLIYP